MNISHDTKNGGYFYDQRRFQFSFGWKEFIVNGQTFLRLGAMQEMESTFDAEISDDMLSLAVQKAFSRNPSTDHRIMVQILPMVMLERTKNLLLGIDRSGSFSLQCSCSEKSIEMQVGQILCMLAKGMQCSLNISFPAGSWRSSGECNEEDVKLVATLSGLREAAVMFCEDGCDTCTEQCKSCKYNQSRISDRQELDITVKRKECQIDIDVSLIQESVHRKVWKTVSNLVPRVKKMRTGSICENCDKFIL
jgi:hypothetical protein